MPTCIKAATTTAGCERCLQLVVRNREVALLRMRESELQLELQQLVARNQELESLRQLRNRELELLQLEVQQLYVRNRELELLRKLPVREVESQCMRESELQLEVQQLAARNREVELQLKVHKLAQATLRVAEAEGPRWCAPRLSFYKCRQSVINVPDPRTPLCTYALSCLFAVCVGRTTNEAPRSGLPTDCIVNAALRSIYP